MAGYTEYVRRSFENDVQEQIEVGEGIAVHYQNTRFDSQAQKEWFKIQSLGFTPVSTNGETRVENWTFQVDCHARMGGAHAGESTDRVWELVDMVVDRYRYLDLTVVNWDESTPRSTVGNLSFLIPEVDPVPLRSQEVEGDQLAVTLPAVFEKFS